MYRALISYSAHFYFGNEVDVYVAIAIDLDVDVVHVDVHVDVDVGVDVDVDVISFLIRRTATRRGARRTNGSGSATRRCAPHARRATPRRCHSNSSHFY